MARTKDKEKYHMILDAALTVFAQNGYHGSQVSKIAKQAGVADGTIYLYFKNKEELLISLFREKLGELIEKAEQHIQHASNAKEAVRIICETHYQELEQNTALAYVTQIELRQSSIELRKAIGKVFKRYIHLIEKVLEQGIQEGHFRADIDVKLTRLLFFGAMDEVVTSWLISEQKYSLCAQVDGTVSFFFHGIEGHGS